MSTMGRGNLGWRIRCVESQDGSKVGEGKGRGGEEERRRRKKEGKV